MLKQTIIVKAWDADSNLTNTEATYVSNLISNLPDEDIEPYDHTNEGVLEAIGLSPEDVQEATDTVNRIFAQEDLERTSQQLEELEKEMSKSYVIRRFVMYTMYGLLKNK